MNTNQMNLNAANMLAQTRAGLDSFFAIVRRLRRDDIDDIAELVVEIKEADEASDRERLDAAIQALLEIFTKPGKQFDAVAPLRTGSRSGDLQKWRRFVGGQVAKLRAAKGMTQVDLSTKTGLPQSHISRIERATLSPSRTTVEKLARALGVSVSKLDPSDN
jgi:DNA-binding XRE family transcriptional regulator